MIWTVQTAQAMKLFLGNHYFEKFCLRKHCGNMADTSVVKDETHILETAGDIQERRNQVLGRLVVITLLS